MLRAKMLEVAVARYRAALAISQARTREYYAGTDENSGWMDSLERRRAALAMQIAGEDENDACRDMITIMHADCVAPQCEWCRTYRRAHAG